MPRKGVPYGGGICSLKEHIAELFDLVGEKLHSINGVQGDGKGDVKILSGDDAIVITNDQIGHKIEVSLAISYPPTTAGTAGQLWQSVGSGQGVWQTLDTAPAADSVKAVTSGGIKAAIDDEASARQEADSALQTAVDAALPASTPQVYVATIPQTDYLDVCLAQYVRIGWDKGLLSLSGHIRDISLPNDAWSLISIDTVMSAMGLTYKRPSVYRQTGWWHYDDGDDHADRYGSGSVCTATPAGGLELARFYSGTDIGSWPMSIIGRDSYISVRDVYVEIQSDAQHTRTLSALAVVPESQHTFRVHQSYL